MGPPLCVWFFFCFCRVPRGCCQSLHELQRPLPTWLFGAKTRCDLLFCMFLSECPSCLDALYHLFFLSASGVLQFYCRWCGRSDSSGVLFFFVSFVPPTLISSLCFVSQSAVRRLLQPEVSPFPSLATAALYPSATRASRSARSRNLDISPSLSLSLSHCVLFAKTCFEKTCLCAFAWLWQRKKNSQRKKKSCAHGKKRGASRKSQQRAKDGGQKNKHANRARRKWREGVCWKSSSPSRSHSACEKKKKKMSTRRVRKRSNESRYRQQHCCCCCCCCFEHCCSAGWRCAGSASHPHSCRAATGRRRATTAPVQGYCPLPPAVRRAAGTCTAALALPGAWLSSSTSINSGGAGRSAPLG